MLSFFLQNNNNLYTKKNLCGFLRNKKIYFSTTTINTNKNKNKSIVKNPYLQKNLFKTEFNIYKFLRTHILVNSSVLRSVKILARVFFKAFKKQYYFELKHKKFYTKNRKFLQYQKRLFKKTIFKKTVMNTLKAFNLLILKRTKVAYKHLKVERLKLFEDYSNEQFLRNYRLEKFVMKQVKIHNILYSVADYNKLIKTIKNLPRQKKYYFVASLNLSRSQANNYFCYYSYRRKFLRLENIKGTTIFPWVNQKMRKYFAGKDKLNNTLVVTFSERFSKLKYFQSLKKRNIKLLTQSRYKKKLWYKWARVLYKKKLIAKWMPDYKVQAKAIYNTRKLTMGIAKYKRSNFLRFCSVYYTKKVFQQTIPRILVNITEKKKGKKKWLWRNKFYRKRLLLRFRKKYFRKFKKIKRNMKKLKYRKNKLLLQYKRIKRVLKKKSFLTNTKQLGFFIKYFYQNKGKAKKLFHISRTAKVYYNLYLKLYKIRKKLYFYQKGLQKRIILLKTKRKYLIKHSCITSGIILNRLWYRLAYGFYRSQRVKKEQLKFLMYVHKVRKQKLKLKQTLIKKKDYHRALGRFFKKQKLGGKYNYMRAYKYYRFKILYFNFIVNNEKLRAKLQKYKYFQRKKYNLKKRFFYRLKKYVTPHPSMDINKISLAEQQSFKYRLFLPAREHLFKPRRASLQIKSRQKKYLRGYVYYKYFRRSYKRKVLNKTLFGLRYGISQILPWRVRKIKYSFYQYQRFSYYWLRYFFHRFKKIYLNEDNGPVYYSSVKRYLLNWLCKLKCYKYLSIHHANPARGFLIYKSTQLYSKYKKYAYPLLLLKRFRPLRDFLHRQRTDWLTRSEIYKKRYKYRSLYRSYYKDLLERKKTAILNKRYRFRRNTLPYIYTHKKHKIFYNWGDRHLLRRYPLYRYKYTLFFKFPRYADYRRLFKNQLREQHVFRYLYRLKLSQLIKHYRKATYKTKRIFELMFLKHFELRLDTVVYRLNFAWSLKHARQLVLRGLFLVNNKIIDSHRYHISLGDVIMPIKRLRMQPLSKNYLGYIDKGLWLVWTRLFWRSIQVDQYPEHFFINERIPAGMLITNVNPDKVRYNKPFSLQFLTLSLLKYN